MSVTVELPWPDKRLSQNARVHWRARGAATKTARERAAHECLFAGGRFMAIETQPRLSWTFHPPNNRRRDIQNVIGSLKAAADGIADALGIDDSKFLNAWPEEFAEPIKGGKIVVTITEASE